MPFVLDPLSKSFPAPDPSHPRTSPEGIRRVRNNSKKTRDTARLKTAAGKVVAAVEIEARRVWQPAPRTRALSEGHSNTPSGI